MIELSFVTGEVGEDGIELTQPTTIDPACIRNFHPRKYGSIGTRIVTRNGKGIPVKEDYEEVRTLLNLGPSRFDEYA